MLEMYKCFFIVLSIQILRANTESTYLYPIEKFVIYSKCMLRDFFSERNVSILSSESLESTYLNDIKRFVLTFNELMSSFYHNINTFITNRGLPFTSFKINNFLWNRTRWFPICHPSNFNATAFNLQMKHELFGQHIVSWSIPKLLNDYLISDKPKKLLLLSFQGYTGCGKSFVSRMITDSLFQEGFTSKCVNMYYGSRDFPHVKDRQKYYENLVYEIPFILNLCDRSIFIFDEIDKMVPGVIDAIIPYIYFYQNSTELVSTNSIFIFISNTGAKGIEKILYNAWLDGIPREHLTLANFSSYLKVAAYNEPGGLQYSEIISKNFIDVFLPFLPMEKTHVKQCIIKELLLHEMPLNNNLINNIADQIVYYPPEFELFSISGCKRIFHYIDLYNQKIS